MVDLSGRESDASIEVTSLHKGFRSNGRAVPVINGLNLSIGAGEVFGILGENGAGKTTLIRMMTTQLVADSGEITVCGRDVVRDQSAVRALINVVEGGDKGLYPWLTARENLRLFALLYRVPRAEIDKKVDALLDRMKLKPEARDRPTMTYSKGMKQLVLLAKGLVNEPRVLFLDEPTVGLDMEAVERIRSTVRELAARGTTVVLTSHNASDVDSVCNRVALIAGGRIERTFTIDELRERYRSTVSFILTDPSVLSRFQAFAGHCTTTPRSTGVELVASLDQRGLQSFYDILAEHPGTVTDISVKSSSLEDFYRELIAGQAA